MRPQRQTVTDAPRRGRAVKEVALLLVAQWISGVPVDGAVLGGRGDGRVVIAQALKELDAGRRC